MNNKKIRSNEKYKTKADEDTAAAVAASAADIVAKKRLMDIMEMPEWQPIGSPLLSDEEGLNRAYLSNEHIYYDGGDKLYIAGTNSMKDLFINDLTIPFRGLI